MITKKLSQKPITQQMRKLMGIKAAPVLKAGLLKLNAVTKSHWLRVNFII